MKYVEVYATNNVINNNEEPTTSAVVLYPSGNMQKGWMVMSLNTGRVLHRHQWNKLPINPRIIDRVEEMGIKERQQYISSNFKYKWDVNQNANDCESNIVNESQGDTEDTAAEDENSVTSMVEYHNISDDVNEILMDETSQDGNNEISNEKVNDTGMEDDTSNGAEGVRMDEGSSSSNTDGSVAKSNNDDEIQPIIEDNVDNDGNDNHSVDDNGDDINNDEGENNDMESVVTEDREALVSSSRYNLRQRANVNYRQMHRYGEVQLMQMQTEWTE